MNRLEETIYADSDVTLGVHTSAVSILASLSRPIVVTTSQAAERWPNKRSSMVDGATVAPARRRISAERRQILDIHLSAALPRSIPSSSICDSVEQALVGSSC